jgi:hypothetical protein
MFHNRNLEQLISFTIVKMGDHSTNCCLLQNSFENFESKFYLWLDIFFNYFFFAHLNYFC